MRACSRQALKIIWLLGLFLIMGFSSVWARQNASIVICAETGAVYHESNADAVTYPASLTKMMTLYLTFKALKERRLSIDQKLLVSPHASRQEPSKLGLKPGSTISVRQAILALITKSANDASVALAEALGKGSEAAFGKSMTQQALKLGMTRTVFRNATGLPNRQQVTTARDMAILSRALYKHFPDYFKLFNTKHFVYKGKTHSNHNHLLGKIDGVDGIKTGFINASGYNLAASMVRNNKRIIAVVLGGESVKARDKKMVYLLEAVHAQVSKNKAPDNGESYASIEELIHELNPPEVYVEDLPHEKERFKKAVYLSNAGKIQTIETKYEDVGAILEDINKKEKVVSKKNSHIRKPPLKRASHKQTLKTQAKKNKKTVKNTKGKRR